LTQPASWADDSFPLFERERLLRRPCAEKRKPLKKKPGGERSSAGPREIFKQEEGPVPRVGSTSKETKRFARAEMRKAENICWVCLGLTVKKEISRSFKKKKKGGGGKMSPHEKHYKTD